MTHQTLLNFFMLHQTCGIYMNSTVLWSPAFSVSIGQIGLTWSMPTLDKRVLDIFKVWIDAGFGEQGQRTQSIMNPVPHNWTHNVFRRVPREPLWTTCLSWPRTVSVQTGSQDMSLPVGWQEGYGGQDLPFLYGSLRNIAQPVFFFFFVSFHKIPDWEFNSQPLSLKVGSFDSDGKPGGHPVIRFFSNYLEIIWWVKFGCFWLYKSCVE
jgi:hypothetical protein